jgi:hypothetical protein
MIAHERSELYEAMRWSSYDHTELGRSFELGFKVIGGEAAEGGMPSFGIVMGEIVADF